VVLQRAEFHATGSGQSAHGQAGITFIRNDFDCSGYDFSLALVAQREFFVFDMSLDMLQPVE
jgi:hypothetical protein